jgi:DNA mismatch repair protein MutS
MGLYDQYTELTRQHRALYGDSTVVLMEVGSFYELYNCDRNAGADVRRVCELLNVQLTRKNKAVQAVSRANPMLAGIPVHALPKYLPVLLENDFTVVIASQVTPPPNVERRVTEVISRTTHLGARSASAGDENHLMCVHADAGTGAGWAVVDLVTGRTAAGEVLSGTTSTVWDELHRQAVVWDPREVAVFGGAGPGGADGKGKGPGGREKEKGGAEGFAALIAHMGLSGRMVHDRGGCNLHARSAYQDAVLRKVFTRIGFLSPAEHVDLERRPLALAAFVAALQFAYDHNETIVARVQRPDVADDGELVLDYNALRQLDVVPSASGGGLLRLLNRCKTPMGRRAFRRRLLRPVRDPAVMRSRYDAIEAVRDTAADVAKKLSTVGDIEAAFRRAVLRRMSPCDVPGFVSSLETAAEAVPGLPELAAIAAELRATVDLDAASRYALTDVRGNVLRAGVSPALDAAQAYLDAARASFQTAADALNVVAGADHVRVESNDADGMWLAVTSRRWDAIRAKGGGGDHTATSSCGGSSVRLLRTGDHALNAHIRDRQAALCVVARDAFVERVLAPLAERADAFAADVAEVERADVACACAINAATMRHSRPVLADEEPGADAGSWVRTTDMRHPIIERVNDAEAYVPNDVSLGCDDTVGMLLYGVNAVGKSSCMKALGLCVIMAQAGMFVPCGRMELRPFERIHTRVGMRDDLYRGHSTFMVEMLELRGILRRANARSLVLGDELCAGTEAVSALSIVGAGLERLVACRAAFVFATHLHELVDLPAVRALGAGLRVCHLAATFEEGRLVLQRRLAPGRGLATYGLEVCKSLDLDAAFMRAADAIRREVLKVPSSIVRPRKSRYNAGVFVDVCASCGAAADHTHHLRPQAAADAAGFVGHVHKDRRANLAALCEQCHAAAHHDGHADSREYVMTSDGLRLLPGKKVPQEKR